MSLCVRSTARTMATKTFFYFVGILLFLHVKAQDNIRCDMNDRYGSCEPGFCCVRDQFLASYVYCKRIPTETHHCITVHSDSECACASGLACKPNINVPTYTSVYGTCKADVDQNFPPSTIPTSTQHKHTHTQH